MISLESQDPKGGVFCSVCTPYICTQSFLVIHNNTRYYILIRYLYMFETVITLTSAVEENSKFKKDMCPIAACMRIAAGCRTRT